jgi:hypothetical protein
MQQAAWIRGIRNPAQTPATPFLSLVMSRSAVRVRSSALFLRLQAKVATTKGIATSVVSQHSALPALAPLWDIYIWTKNTDSGGSPVSNLLNSPGSTT